MSQRFNKTIIITDLDGTFLGHKGELLPKNLEAVEYFKSEGGRFTIATGRERLLALLPLPELAQIVNFPAVVCNGAVLYDFRGNETVACEYLDEGAFELCRDLREQFPEATMKVTVGEHWYFDREKDVSYGREYPDLIHVCPVEDFPREGWLKILFASTPERISELKEYAAQSHPEYVYLQSWARGVEIQSQLGNKGAMVKRMRTLKGAEDSVIWAVGDYENDIPMLTSACRCACPSNAISEVKSLPGIVELCEHGEGAIADLIRRLDHSEL